MAQSIQEANELYREALDASRDQRRQIEEDLAFTDPAEPEQWDWEVKRKRESDPGGKRPCLVFDQIGQYIQNVTGNIEQQPPSMHALPVDGGADRKVAEQLDGFFRHIEYSSRGTQHYLTAELSAARAGVGYLIVRPEYVNRALNWQEPRLSSEGDPLRVVFDPWSTELDGSDATFGNHLKPYSHREFERRWPKAAKVSFGADERCDERSSIVVADGWWIEEKRVNQIVCQDPNGGPEARLVLTEDEYWERDRATGQRLPVYATYMDKVRKVMWARMSGAEYLDEPTEYPADAIGIIPVYGYVSYRNGRLSYCGMGRRARNPQQAYNYHRSEMLAYMGQAPKSPWIASTRAVAGLEALWDKSSIESRGWLPYNDIDEQGNSIQAPQRASIAVNLANHGAEAETAKQDIQAALGMYQANLGAPSNETSGVAIESRKQQGEASTAVFPAHLNASVAQAGRVIMQMIPRLIDTKRQVRILGMDMTPGSVTIDPQQEQGVVETPQGLSINPNVGHYDVRIVAGASFATQRSQAQTAFAEMMRTSPEMTPALAPLWAQTLDIPQSDKLAQVFTAIAPPEVKAILQPGGQEEEGPSKAELAAQLQQMQAALQQAIETAREAEQDLDECQAKLAAKEAEAEIRAYEAETKRMVGLKDAMNPEAIQALVIQTLEQMLSSPAPLAGEQDEAEETEGEPTSFEMQPMPADFGEEPMPIDQESM